MLLIQSLQHVHHAVARPLLYCNSKAAPRHVTLKVQEAWPGLMQKHNQPALYASTTHIGTLATAAHAPVTMV